MSAYDDLRTAGFNDGEISDHVWNTQGDDLRRAGFTPDEITSHVTGLAAPGKLADAALDRMNGATNASPPLRVNADPVRVAEAQQAVPYHTQVLADRAAMTHQAVPPVEPGFWQGVMDGILDAGIDVKGGGQALVGAGAPRPLSRGEQAGAGWWNSLGHQIGYAWPTVAAYGAGTMASAAIGSAVEPGGGTLAGGALGLFTSGPVLAGAVSGLQTLARTYWDERQRTPNDPRGAYVRAFAKASQAGAFTGASYALFHLPLFRAAVERSLVGTVTGPAEQAAWKQIGTASVKDLMVQAGLIQPAVAGAETALTNVEEGSDDWWNVPKAMLAAAAGTAVPMGIGEAARRVPGAAARAFGRERGYDPNLDLNQLAAEMKVENDKLIKQGLVQSGGVLERVNPQTGKPESIGRGVPEAQDFTDAARALGGGVMDPVVRDGLIDRWENGGIHPAEIAKDAQIDPSLARFTESPLAPEPPGLPPRDAPPAADRLAAIRFPFRFPEIKVEPPRVPEVREPPEPVAPGEAKPPAAAPPPPVTPPTPTPGLPKLPPMPPEPAPPPPPPAPEERRPEVKPDVRPGEVGEPVREPEVAAPRPAVTEAPPEAEPLEPVPPEPVEGAEPVEPVERAEPVEPEVGPPREEVPPPEPAPELAREVEPGERLAAVEPREPTVYERFGEPPPPSNQNASDTDILWGPDEPRRLGLEDTDRGWIARNRDGDQLGIIVTQWDEAQQRYAYYASALRDGRAVEIAGEREQRFDNVDDAQHYVERMVRGGRYDEEGHRAAMREIDERNALRELARPVKGAFEQIRDAVGQAPGFFERIWNNYAQFMTPEEFLRSEPAWSGARALANEWGWREAEAFSYLANEMLSRMGATQRMTPRSARMFMARERGIRAVPDAPETRAQTVTSLAQAIKIHGQVRKATRAQLQALARDLLRFAEQVLGPHVEMKFYAGKGIPGGAEWSIWGDQGGPTVGQYTEQRFKDGLRELAPGLVEIALGSDRPFVTAFHEFWHGFESMLATMGELDRLHVVTDQMRDLVANTLELSGDQAQRLSPFEVRAVTAQVLFERKLTNIKDVPKPFRRVYEWAQELIDRVKDVGQRLGLPVKPFAPRIMRDLTRDLLAGKMRERPRWGQSSGLEYMRFVRGELLEGEGPQAMAVRREEERGSFRTASGEEYRLGPEGTTVRAGQPASAKTYYLTPDNADTLMPPQDRTWRIVDHGDKTLSVFTKPRGKRDWVLAEDIFRVPVETAPRPGLVPVELGKSSTTKGRTAYGKIDRGQIITEVREPRPALPEPAAAGEPLFHGSLAEGITTLPAGTHVGTLEAARDRIDRLMDLPDERRPKGVARAGQERPTVYRVGEAPRRPLEFGEAQWNNPEIMAKLLLQEKVVTRAEHDEILRSGDYISVLRRKGYDAIAYENEREHPGSRSYMLLQEAAVTPHTGVERGPGDRITISPPGEPRAKLPESAAALSDAAAAERGAPPAPAAAGGGAPEPEAEPPAGRVRGPRATGRAAADPATWTIVEFLTSRDNAKPGLKPIAELTDQLGKNAYVPGMGAVFRQDGMDLTEAVEAAIAGGYLSPEVRRDVDGGHKAIVKLITARVLKPRPVDVAEEREKVESQLVNALGLDGTPEDPVDLAVFNRAVSLMARGYERNPIDAFRMALMEDTQHAANTEVAPQRREYIPGFDDDAAAPPEHRAAIEERAGAEPVAAPPEGAEVGEAARPPGERAGAPGGGAERQAQESEPTPAEQASAERSNNGLDGPVAAGSQREAWNDEAHLADEAARDNPQLKFDMDGRAAAARNEAVRKTDPSELSDPDWDKLERLSDLQQEANTHGARIVGELEPAAVPGGPGDSFDGGAGAGGSGAGGRITGGDHARIANNTYYREGMKERFFRWYDKFIMSPLTMAHLDTRFALLWQALRDRFMRNNELIEEGKRRFESFNKLDKLGQDRVLRVLELERLKGTTYNPDAKDVSILNDEHPHAALTNLGDVAAISTPEEMAAYHDMRQFFQGRWADLAKATKRRFGLDPRATAAQLKELADRAQGRDAKRLGKLAMLVGTIEESERQGYVPFARWGDYYIHVKAKPGEMLDGKAVGPQGATAWFSLVKTRFAMDKIMGRGAEETVHPEFGRMPLTAAQEITRLREAFPAAQFDIEHGRHFPKTDALRDIGMPVVDKLMTLMGSDVRKTLATQYGEGTSASVIRDAEQKFWDGVLDSLTDQIANEMKAGFKRRARNTPGYDKDFRRAIGQYMNWTADHIANVETRDRIQGVMDNHIANHPDPEVRQYAANLLSEVDRDPTNLEHVLRRARQGAFLWALGFNPSSFVTAIAHDPMKGSAVLGVTIGSQARAAARLTYDMQNILRATSFDREFGAVTDVDKMDLTPRLKAWVEDMNDKGITRGHGARTLAGSENFTEAPGEFAMTKGEVYFNRVMNYGGAFMHKADIINRLSPGLAAMREFIDNPAALTKADAYWRGHSEYYRSLAASEGVSPETMSRFLVEFIGGMNDPFNRAPIMRGSGVLGPMGPMLFQFRTYTSSYLSQLNFLYRHAGPEGRIAVTMMLGQLAVLGGVAAFPFSMTAKEGYDYAYEFFKGVAPNLEDDIEDAMEALGMPRIAAEAALHGIPYATMGVDLGSRVGFGEEMRRLVESPFGAAPSIGYRAVTEAWNRYNSGQGAAAVVQSFSPNVIRSILMGQKTWPEQGVVTQYGQTVMSADELTLGDRWWRTLGFQPSAVSRTYDKRNEITSMIRYNRSKSEDLHARLAALVMARARAANNGDTARYEDLTRRINAAWDAGRSQGIITDGGAAYRAVMARVRQANNPELGEIMRLPKSMRAAFLAKYRKEHEGRLGVLQ